MDRLPLNITDALCRASRRVDVITAQLLEVELGRQADHAGKISSAVLETLALPFQDPLAGVSFEADWLLFDWSHRRTVEPRLLPYRQYALLMAIVRGIRTGNYEKSEEVFVLVGEAVLLAVVDRRGWSRDLRIILDWALEVVPRGIPRGAISFAIALLNVVLAHHALEQFKEEAAVEWASVSDIVPYGDFAAIRDWITLGDAWNESWPVVARDLEEIGASLHKFYSKPDHGVSDA